MKKPRKPAVNFRRNYTVIKTVLRLNGEMVTLKVAISVPQIVICNLKTGNETQLNRNQEFILW
jgi:hypothetical protein